MERKPYRFSELFSGDWNLFTEVLENPKTTIVYDADLTLINLADVVAKDFYSKHGIQINLDEYDSWTYLTKMAKENKLDEDAIKHAEDGWYSVDSVGRAHRYLYTKPLVNKTISLYGANNNYILTARHPGLEETTINSIKREFPNFLPENILMRKSGGITSVEDTALYKASELMRLSKIAPWVVFIDDSTGFTKAAINLNIKNLLVVNIPFGKMCPDYKHDRLIVIDRYPNMDQGIYPLMDALDRATVGMKPLVAHS